ncbi:MAG: hypothetical protein SCL54_14995 [Bacillota bacterium]|nr:hypothetical protein [Bacillota bacterium]
MDKKYYDAKKSMRNYLSGLGFPFEQVTLREGVTTYRFEITPELQEALSQYQNRFKTL